MKKALLSLLALASLLIVTGISPLYTAPGDTSPHGDYDRDLMEVYFKRAEAAADEAEWRETVTQGIATVVARWENAAQLAVGDPGALAAEKALLESALGEEADQRLTDFLLQKFFRGLSGPEIEGVLQAVEDANREYLYTWQDGRVVRDEAGDPVFKKYDNLENDRQAWNAMVNARIQEVTAAWETASQSVWDNLGAADPELLASLNGQAGDFQLKLAAYKQGYANEFQRIRAQEERIFLDKRVSDQFSLRVKTDEEAAAETVARLIAEAEAEGEAGIRRVRDGLERLDIEVSVKGLDVSSSDWLKSFEREFTSGLDKWEGAEREFLRRRGEWEKEVGIRFEEGQREWAEAFRRLQDARAGWEGDLIRVKELGLRMWREKEDKLAVSLQEASERLEAAIGQRTSGVGLQIEALMDMYLQANSIFTTALNSIEFWEEDIGGLLGEYCKATGENEEAVKGRFDTALAAYIQDNNNGALDQLVVEIKQDLENASQAILNERMDGFDELCTAMNAFIGAHSSPETTNITVAMDPLDPHVSSVHSEGMSWTEFDPLVAAGYLDTLLNARFAANGTAIVSLYDQMKAFNPHQTEPGEGDEITITLTYHLEDQGSVYFSRSMTKTCWSEAWQAKTRGFMEDDAARLAERAGDAEEYVTELKFWLKQKADYQNSMNEAAQALTETYGLSLGDEVRDELGVVETGPEEARSTDWSEVLLDDYQRELLIALGERNYWRKQLAVARAVAEYANTSSSERPTEAETHAAYEQSLADFEAAEQTYQDAVSALEGFGQDVDVKRADYQAAKAAWDEARQAVAEKEALYQEKMGVLMNMGGEYYRNRIQSQYDELLVAYGLKVREGQPGFAETMADYLAALKHYGDDSAVAASAGELTVLLNGSVSRGLLSLDGLRRQSVAGASLVSYAPPAGPDQTYTAATVNQAGLYSGHPRAAELEAAAAAYNALIADKDADPEEVRLARLTLDALSETIKGEAEEAYRRRLEAVSLFASPSYSGWTEPSAAGAVLSESEILDQAGGAEAEYLSGKAELLFGALNKINDGTFTREGLDDEDDLNGEEKLALACLSRFDAGEMTALAVALDKIRGVLKPVNGAYQALSEYRDAVAGLDDADGIVSAFFQRGGNIFADTDYADLFAPDLAAKWARRIERARLLGMYADTAPALASERADRALEALGGYLASTGLGAREGEAFTLTDPEALWRSVAGGKTVNRQLVLDTLTRFEDGLNAIPAGLPAWIRERLSGYLSGIADYFTLQLVMAQKPDDTDDLAALTAWHEEKLSGENGLDEENRDLEAEQEALEQRGKRLLEFENALADPTARGTRKLTAVYQAFKNGEEWLTEDMTDDGRCALTAAEAEAELVKAAGSALALKAYDEDTLDLQGLLDLAAGELGLKDLDPADTAVRAKIITAADALLRGARRIDESLTSRDFTLSSGPEARYALWQRLAPEAVTAEIGGLDAAAVDNIRKLMAGPAGDRLALRGRLNLTALESVAGIKGEGRVYSRALYLGLKAGGLVESDLAAVWTFLLDAYEIADRDSADALAAFSAAPKTEAENALYCYGGSVFGKVYFLKQLIFSGEDYQPYLSGLGPDERAEIDKFISQLATLEDYLPGLDSSLTGFAAEHSAGGAVAASAVGSLLEMGIDDPFFMQFEGAAGRASLDFRALHGEGMARSLSALLLENASLKEEALTEESRTRARLAAQVGRERGLIERWLNCDAVRVERSEGVIVYNAKYGFNYRMALEEDNLEPESEEETPLGSRVTTELIADDPAFASGIYHYDSGVDKSGYLNEELDQYNALLLEARGFQAGLSQPAAASEKRAEYFTAAQQLNALFDEDANNDPDIQALISALSGINADEEGFNSARSAYAGAAERIGYLKSSLGGAAEALEAVNTLAADYRAKVIDPLVRQLDELKSEFAAADEVLGGKKEAFLAANQALQEKENELASLFDALEDKRSKLQTAEEILEYARSIYLTPEGGGDSLAVDPNQRLAQVALESSKADLAYQTLKSLFAANERRQSMVEANAGLLTAFEEYGDSYRSFLRMKEAQELIEEALQVQYGNVERARQKAVEILADLGSAESLKLLSMENEGDDDYADWYEDFLADPTLKYGTAEFWLSIFNLPSQKGEGEYDSWAASMSLDGDFSIENIFPEPEDETGRTALEALQTQAGDYVFSDQFTRDFEAWADRLTGGTGAAARLQEWEDAYYFFMTEVATGGFFTSGQQLYLTRPHYETRCETGGGSDPGAHHSGGYCETVENGVEYYLNPALMGRMDQIKTLARPYSERYYWENHGYDIYGNPWTGSPCDFSDAPLLERIQRGRQAYQDLKNNSDFNFFVFLTKTGIMQDSAFMRTAEATGNSKDGFFSKWYEYREFETIDPAILTRIQTEFDLYHAEEEKLALLKNGGGEIGADTLLNAVVQAAKLVKPEGFDYASEAVDAQLADYFRGAVDTYFGDAYRNYRAGQGETVGPGEEIVFNGQEKQMADVAGLTAAAAALGRAAKKQELEAAVLQLQYNQENPIDGSYTAYQNALAALRNAGTQEEAAAGAAALRAEAERALKNCAYQDKDILSAYYRLYESIIGEYIGGFKIGTNDLFESEGPTRGITSRSAVFSHIQELMDLERESLLSLYEERLNGYLAVQTDEMRQKQAELAAREADWTEKMDAILERGQTEWAKARQTFETAWQDWGNTFNNEYKAKDEQWAADYLQFELNKNTWIAGAEKKLAETGKEGLAEAMGVEADEGIALSLSRLVPDMTDMTVRPGEVVSGILGSGLFDRISSYAALLNNGIDLAGTSLRVALAGENLMDAQVFARVEDFLADRREEIGAHAAVLTAAAAEQSVDEAIENMEHEIAKANKNVDRNLDGMFDNAGFVRSGASYSRSAVMSSAVFTGEEYATQTVGAYVYFTAPRLKSGVDLSPDATKGLDQEGVNALVDKAVRNIRTQFETIMGAKKDSADGEESEPDGLFQLWVGEQASLKETGVNPDAEIGTNLAEQGTGEMGRIFRAFLDAELKKNKGESELKAPLYAKPLWGEFLGMDGPSIRTLVDIGMSIASAPLAAMTPVGWAASTILNSLDDMLFLTLDIVNHNGDCQQLALDFGKKVAMNAISGGLGAAGTAAGTALKLGTDALGVIGKTAISGIQSLVTNSLTGLVNAVEYDASGNLSWNADRYRESVIGTNAMAGYFGAMTQAFTGNLLASGDLRTNGGFDITSGSGINALGIMDFNSLMGSATGALMEYAISGQTSINLLRIGGVGVLEARLGKDRCGLGIGMGGYDISVGKIASAAGGFADAMQVMDWRYGDIETSRNLDIVAGAAYARNQEVRANAALVWQGKVNIAYDDIVTENGDQALGKYDHTDPNKITLSRELLQDSRETTAQLLSAFAHEGTHYGGSQVEADAHMSGLTTYLDVAKILGVKDDSFIMSMVNELRDERNYAENTGDVDYWTLRSDGYLVRDGRSALYDENGDYIAGAEWITGKTSGKDRKILEALGLLRLLGMKEDKAGKNWAMTQGNEVKLDYNHLQYLAAEDHYRVLVERGFLDPKVTLQEWTLDNARNNGHLVTNDFTAYLEKVDKNTAINVGGMFDSFFKHAKNADDMLEKMRTGMQVVKELYAGVNPHDMLLFANKVFRGQGGDMGLAKALEKSYEAKGFDERWSRGLMIQDVAMTFTEQYVHIIYGQREPKDGIVGSVYKGNYGFTDMGYGQILTHTFKPIDQDSPKNHPACDCAGFISMVYYAAGLLREGESLGETRFERNGVSESVWRAPGFENSGLREVYGETAGGRASFTIDSWFGRAKVGGKWGGSTVWRDFRTGGGGTNAYYNTKIEWADDPIPGDIMFMDGHVGLYGAQLDSSKNVIQNFMIHSAPDPFYTGWSDLGHMESGPRTNYFNIFNQKNREDNSSYFNRLNSAELFSKWKDAFSYNFARWRNRK